MADTVHPRASSEIIVQMEQRRYALRHGALDGVDRLMAVSAVSRLRMDRDGLTAHRKAIPEAVPGSVADLVL